MEINTTDIKYTVSQVILNDIIDSIFDQLPLLKCKNYFYSHNPPPKNTSPIKRKNSISNNNNNSSNSSNSNSSNNNTEPIYIPKRILFDTIVPNYTNTDTDKYTNTNTDTDTYIHINTNIDTTTTTTKIENNQLKNNNIIFEKEEIIKGNKVYTWQPKVLKQNKNDSCGYYSLFNSISILNACFNSDGQEAVQIFKQLQSRTLFWYTYITTIKILLEKARHSKKKLYPWTEKCVYKGVLERSYIDYLFERENVLSNQQYPITFLPDWAIQSLKNNRLPIDEMKEMTRIAQLFKTHDNYTHIFILGQAVHWITIIINKVGTKSEIILMDSRNYDLLGSTDQQFMAIANKYPELSDRMKQGFLYSLREPRILVQILKDCMLGDGDITKTLLQLNLIGFLENYYSHVIHQNHQPAALVSSSFFSCLENYLTNDDYNGIDGGCDFDSPQQQLIYWLENYWPPSVIEYNICQVLDTIITCKEDVHRYIEYKTLQSLSIWIKHTKDQVKDSLQVSLIQRFSITINWFHQKFSLLN
ncbi:hypothetical protein CYY_008105 [Polysphondylium violaceum]|uniref:Uncharacterized protein n=1 Tax=Polysphondylium violaceum TaxID=133409 RepID=A0A8J4V4C0_9MYCE|nr:hypothetical protein CYY_008105 [Polysphondylium violaceum]